MKAKFIHTMIRVENLDRAIEFYCGALGMKELRRFDNPSQKYTLVFVGYGDEKTSHCLELTYNYGVNSYDKGEVYGHIALAVEDCEAATKAVADKGGNVVRPAGPLVGGSSIIAFCEDPEGNKIELIERGPDWFTDIG